MSREALFDPSSISDSSIEENGAGTAQNTVQLDYVI